MMENNKNLISVIIPLYNAEKYLKNCMTSVVGETYRKSLGKDMFERAKNPLCKNAKGIRFAQETIILSTFSKMKQRDISKENNDTEVEQD